MNHLISESDMTISKGKRVFLRCCQCKETFTGAWDLMFHVQNAHGVNIYNLDEKEQVCIKMILYSNGNGSILSHICFLARATEGTSLLGSLRSLVRTYVSVCTYISVFLSKRPSSFCLIHFGGSSRVEANLRWKTTFDGRRH